MIAEYRLRRNRTKNHPEGQVIALAIGAAIALAVIGGLVLKSGAALSSQPSGPSTLSGGIDTFLGVLLWALGIKTCISRNKPKKRRISARARSLAAFFSSGI